MPTQQLSPTQARDQKQRPTGMVQDKIDMLYSTEVHAELESSLDISAQATRARSDFRRQLQLAVAARGIRPIQLQIPQENKP